MTAGFTGQGHLKPNTMQILSIFDCFCKKKLERDVGFSPKIFHTCPRAWRAVYSCPHKKMSAKSIIMGQKPIFGAFFGGFSAGAGDVWGGRLMRKWHMRHLWHKWHFWHMRKCVLRGGKKPPPFGSYRVEGGGGGCPGAYDALNPVSYTHLTLPTTILV